LTLGENKVNESRLSRGIESPHIIEEESIMSILLLVGPEEVFITTVENEKAFMAEYFNSKCGREIDAFDRVVFADFEVGTITQGSFHFSKDKVVS